MATNAARYGAAGSPAAAAPRRRALASKTRSRSAPDRDPCRGSELHECGGDGVRGRQLGRDDVGVLDGGVRREPDGAERSAGHEHGEDQRLRCAGVEQRAQRKRGGGGQRREHQDGLEAEAPDQRRRRGLDSDVPYEHGGHHRPGVQRIPAESGLEHQRQQERHGADGQPVHEAARGRRAECPGAENGQIEQRRAGPPHPGHGGSRGTAGPPRSPRPPRIPASRPPVSSRPTSREPTPSVVRASPSQSRRRVLSPATAGTRRRAARKAARPRGRLTRKIQCQDR